MIRHGVIQLALSLGWQVSFSNACASDLDCSLNGECKAGKCACDKPWSGDACETMNFKPVTFPQGYGMSPNLTTWGGNAIYDDKTQEYHIYVSAMTNGCPLSTWGKNSRIEHGVSKTITGPYEFKDVAINTWSHNAAPVALKDGTYAIFHIGDGSGSASGGRNCTHEGVDRGYTEYDRQRELEEIGGGSTIHVANSLNGPWQPLQPNTLGGCNNPAPWVHPNGTIFIVCGGSFKRADNIKGPWTTVATFSHSGGPEGNYEDPFLYTTARGFHAIYHVYNTHEHPPHGHECFDSTVSAHVFSSDGFTWHTSPTQPYGTQVQLTTGTTVTVATRERPKIWFNNAGHMTHLFNGVCGAPNCPNGPATGCVDCKYANWDYTLVQPLAVDDSLIV